MQTTTFRLDGHRLLLLLLVVSGLYMAGFFFWYSGTPLGLVPVLDGRENLLLASQMADGSLPVEPFYRAPLYPFLLSLPLRLGFPTDALPFIARLLNGYFHLLSTALVFGLSLRLWASRPAALVSGLLVGVNPVLLHFASDPLDITLAITWLLLACHAGLSALESKRLRPALLAGVFLILGTYTRPHLLPVALACPLALLPSSRRQALAALATVVAGMALFGAINAARSGSFTILPTQGVYNLWAANKPGANGSYYMQSIDVSQSGEYTNPARQEADLLYSRETGQTAGTDFSAERAFWRKKTLGSFLDEPGRWLDLMVHKAGILLGNYEPYNNKTYAFHRALSPWLRWNPLGWALILALAVFGTVSFPQRPGVRLIAFWALVYAAGVLLFYVSARFRLPLVPLLAILAGGTVPALRALGTRRWIWGSLGLAAGVFLVSLTNSLSAPNTSTTSEDCLLIAQASNELARDGETLIWARRSYDRRPTPAAAELITLAQFNLWLSGSLPPPSAEALRGYFPLAQEAARASRQARWVLGVMRYKSGQHAEAIEIWQDLLEPRDSTAGDALAMLVLEREQPPREKWERPLAITAHSPLLKIVLQRQRWGPSVLTEGQRDALDFLTAPLPPVNKP